MNIINYLSFVHENVSHCGQFQKYINKTFLIISSRPECATDQYACTFVGYLHYKKQQTCCCFMCRLHNNFTPQWQSKKWPSHCTLLWRKYLLQFLEPRPSVCGIVLNIRLHLHLMLYEWILQATLWMKRRQSRRKRHRIPSTDAH